MFQHIIGMITTQSPTDTMALGLAAAIAFGLQLLLLSRDETVGPLALGQTARVPAPQADYTDG